MVYIHNFKAQSFIKHIRCPQCSCHVSHLFFSCSLPSGTCQCCSRGQSENLMAGINTDFHIGCVYFCSFPWGLWGLSVLFSSHFLPRNFSAACKGGNPALLGKGELGGSLKMLKTLCTPECLLKKSQITQLSVGCAKGFAPCRYKISSTLPSRAQNCSQCTNSSPTRQKLALEIESTESRVSSPINHQDLLLIHKIVLATWSLCLWYRILFLFLKLLLYPYTLQCPLWTGKSQASERRSWWKKKNCNWTTQPLLKWIRPVNQNHHQWWGVWLKISRKNMEWLIL